MMRWPRLRLQTWLGEAVDRLPDMAKFPGHKGITPNSESGLARSITKYIIFADNVAVGICFKPKVRFGEPVKDLHVDQQAAGRNATHFQEVA